MLSRLLLIVLIAFPFLGQAQNRRPLQGSTPLWITSQNISYNDTSLDDQAEDGYSDLDFESQYSLKENTAYYKKAYRILTEAGVQNCSEISIDFDPSYEQLTFHTIKIIRNGVTINKLQLSKFSVLQQEKDRDRFIYDGSLTALLVLDDVRKGDIVEYSYSIKGSNPILKNKFCADFRLQFGVPIYKLYYKVIVPQGRKIKVDNLNSDMEATLSYLADATIYEWRLNKVTARQSSEQAPSWYDVSPYVMVSEFLSWREIVNLGRELFPLVTNLSTPLQSKIDEINSTGIAEEKVGKALRFVQDDIRYLGIEMGANSHKPHSPNEVFAQRFGDCKDKSYLLCTMLRAMNIEAWPVMINTTAKEYISNWLPTPFAFDHVTTMVKVNGKYYFFDPTIAYQRGSINNISFPDYQMGLVIADFSTGLAKINKRNYGKTSVYEQFDVSDVYGVAKLKVKTVYSGSYADDVRYDFQMNSRKEILNRYVDFYKSYFEDIEGDSVTVEESPDGSLTTYETYSLPNFWKESDGKRKMSFQPYMINAVIKRPKDKKSSYPFELKYPANLYEEISVKYPEDWSITGSGDRIENNAFRFSSKLSAGKDHSALLVYRYENFKSLVAAEELSDYGEALEKMDEATVFDVSYKSGGKTVSSSSEHKSSNDSGFKFSYAYLYVLLFVCVVITFVVKRNRRTA